MARDMFQDLVVERRNMSIWTIWVTRLDCRPRDLDDLSSPTCRPRLQSHDTNDEYEYSTRRVECLYVLQNTTVRLSAIWCNGGSGDQLHCLLWGCMDRDPEVTQLARAARLVKVLLCIATAFAIALELLVMVQKGHNQGGTSGPRTLAIPARRRPCLGSIRMRLSAQARMSTGEGLQSRLG